MMSLINTGKNKGTGVRVMALMVAKHRKGMSIASMDFDLIVDIPMRDSIMANRMFKDYLVMKMVTFHIPGKLEFSFEGKLVDKPLHMISVLGMSGPPVRTSFVQGRSLPSSPSLDRSSKRHSTRSQETWPNEKFSPSCQALLDEISYSTHMSTKRRHDRKSQLSDAIRARLGPQAPCMERIPHVAVAQELYPGPSTTTVMPEWPSHPPT
ncbi:hypothetical protein CK203_055919 [Vitis vinifera]|uniref:Uncharacterized protein n=1 Tax=Vitis vinifera TaxID=29760 RepID=A0A438FTV1_VITVI|nr:hypothetical protein CK203_055919 [Vitis vinifera]